MKEALVHVRLELTTLALSERGADNAKVVSSNLTWTKAVSVFCSEGIWSSNCCRIVEEQKNSDLAYEWLRGCRLPCIDTAPTVLSCKLCCCNSN